MTAVATGEEGWVLYASPVAGGHDCDYLLGGLRASYDHARVIMTLRPDDLQSSLSYLQGVRLDLRLAREEAEAIWGGADPLAVLLPGMIARVLSLHELENRA